MTRSGSGSSIEWHAQSVPQKLRAGQPPAHTGRSGSHASNAWHEPVSGTHSAPSPHEPQLPRQPSSPHVRAEPSTFWQSGTHGLGRHC